MIGRTHFYDRLAVCKTCEFWQGACLKGHVLQGSLGCPVRKFEGVEGAGYMEDMPLPTPELPQPGAPGCCGAVEGDLQPLSWVAVWKHLAESMRAWQKSGYALTPAEAYTRRIDICKACPKGEYRWYQCRHCKCIVYSKAKLATEVCPHGLWPKLS